MKKFWGWFFGVLIVVVLSVLLISWIMSEIHDVTIISELKNWCEAIAGLFSKKENTEPVAETAKILFKNVA